MAVMRGPDGKIIESGGGGGGGGQDTEQTRRVDRRSVRGDPMDDATRMPPKRAAAPAVDDERADFARPKTPPRPQAPAAPAEPTAAPPPQNAAPRAGGDPKTAIIGRARRKPAVDRSQEAEESKGESDQMDDPVVGWVVVVEGPGRGASQTLGYGMNSIGRAKTERVCLDYGDEEISRTQHALITYDPRGRKYFVQHGGGKNLTYLGDSDPVLMPAELKGGEEIVLGQTRLRFVPFCGKEFDWQDQNDR